MNAIPVLPEPALAALYLAYGWGLVLAAGTLALLRHLRPAAPRLAFAGALLVLLSVFLPGVLSPAYWFGLAFQAPSLSSALLCAHLLWRGLGPQRAAPGPSGGMAALLPLYAGLWLLGALLIVDTLAWLPGSLYALGFHPLAPALVLLLGLLPWLVYGAPAWRQPALRLVPVVVLLFALTRWPSGNVWDALLDPWLWLALSGLGLRAAWLRVKAP